MDMNASELRRLTERRIQEARQKRNQTYLAEKAQKRKLWLPKALELFQQFQIDSALAANDGESQIKYTEHEYQTPLLEVFADVCSDEGFSVEWIVDRTGFGIEDSVWRVLIVSW